LDDDAAMEGVNDDVFTPSIASTQHPRSGLSGNTSGQGTIVHEKKSITISKPFYV